MLVDTYDLDLDPVERLLRYTMRDVVAIDEQSGCQLRAGAGRRRAGRPRRYFIYAPVDLLPAGHYNQTQIGTTTAFADADAIAQANKRLTKLLDAHLVATFPEQHGVVEQVDDEAIERDDLLMRSEQAQDLHARRYG